MRTGQKIFFAKLLIFFSILLIFFGGFLQIRENKVMHPIDDVTMLNDYDDTKITITTANFEDFVDHFNGEEKNPTVEEPVTPEISPTPTPSLEPTPVPSPTPDSVPAPEPPVVEQEPIVEPTIDELNISIRNKIQSTYGIIVKYGYETSGYSVGGMSTTVVTDANVSNVALNNLYNALSLYPMGFFKEFSDNNYPLTINLVKRFNRNNVTGVTASQPSGTKISIALDYNEFLDTVHHEIYHYIENYIYSKGYTFLNWNSFNPIGFNYNVIDYNYSYTRTFSENAYFVNDYAQDSQEEDRASTFEYMMKSTKASCLNYGKTVWSKAKTISQAIDYFLTTVSPYTIEHWERYIY